MLVRYDLGAILGPIGKLLFGSQQPQQQYFNSGPSAADVKRQQDETAMEAKNKSLADTANRQGAASSLITAADSGSEFSGLKTRKTLLGGA